MKNRACQAKELKEKQAVDFPKIIRACDFMKTTIPKPPEVVRGVLHKGSKGQYGGPSKAFKTWSLLDLCLSVANGAPWFGFETAKGRTLYLNFELQDFALQSRIQDISRAKCVEIGDSFDIWNLRDKNKPLPDLMPELVRQIEGEGYSLIVPDPIYKALGDRDENKAGDIGALCGELGAISSATGAAVIWGNHFAKGNAAGKNAIDRVSGSGVWARDPDTLIIATPHTDEGAFSVEVISRNFPTPDPFCIVWEFPLMVRNNEKDPAKLKKSGGATPVYNVDKIIEHLTPGMKTKQWLTACVEELGISERSFYAYRDQAKHKGRIIQDTYTKGWSVK